MRIEERVAKLEADKEHKDIAWSEQIKANTDLYERTEANTLSSNTLTTQGRILKWIMGIVITASVGMIFMVAGSLILHWLIAGKPGV